MWHKVFRLRFPRYVPSVRPLARLALATLLLLPLASLWPLHVPAQEVDPERAAVVEVSVRYILADGFAEPALAFGLPWDVERATAKLPDVVPLTRELARRLDGSVGPAGEIRLCEPPARPGERRDCRIEGARTLLVLNDLELEDGRATAGVFVYQQVRHPETGELRPRVSGRSLVLALTRSPEGRWQVEELMAAVHLIVG